MRPNVPPALNSTTGGKSMESPPISTAARKQSKATAAEPRGPIEQHQSPPVSLNQHVNGPRRPSSPGTPRDLLASSRYRPDSSMYFVLMNWTRSSLR